MIVHLPSQGEQSSNPVIEWNSTAQRFDKIGTQVCNDGSGCTIATQAAEPYSTETLFNNGRRFLSFDIPGIGFTGLPLEDFENGNIYKAPTNGTEIRIFTNAIEAPSSGASTLTLYCFDQCPVQVDGTIANYSTNENVESIKYTIVMDIDAQSPYILLGPTGTVDGNNQLTDVSETPSISMANNGIWELFTTNSRAERFAEPVFYSWQAGNNQWQQYITFQDSDGNLTAFDAPLKLIYTDDDNTEKYVQYEGFGRISGIPEVCKNIQTGEEVNCYDNNANTEDVIFEPRYNLDDDAANQPLTTLDGQSEYYSKQLEKAQIMSPLTGDDKTACIAALSSTMAQAEAETLPTVAAYWTNPSLGAKPTDAKSTDANNHIISGS
ncbi:hypothetical protein [Facilibium subflavum]|uniref:hypothetical protein n=1 Tax=Facilibium subflavum TaxID=2219058 RepID=UPI000E64C6B6|nr:hypothetical protein [Facilibium subflavum]